MSLRKILNTIDTRVREKVPDQSVIDSSIVYHYIIGNKQNPYVVNSEDIPDESALLENLDVDQTNLGHITNYIDELLILYQNKQPGQLLNHSWKRRGEYIRAGNNGPFVALGIGYVIGAVAGALFGIFVAQDVGPWIAGSVGGVGGIGAVAAYACLSMEMENVGKGICESLYKRTLNKEFSNEVKTLKQTTLNILQTV